MVNSVSVLSFSVPCHQLVKSLRGYTKPLPRRLWAPKFMIEICWPGWLGNEQVSSIILADAGKSGFRINVDAQALIILSNIDGIYNGSPADPASEVIREIGQGKDLSSYIQTSKSSFGRGGMLTKTNIARKVADEGITVIIANGKRDNILVDLIQHPESTLCTRFTPSPAPVSSVKKWIAHSEGFAKGELHINYCATELLFSDKAVSILPVGIIDVIGEFEKDDIVRIVDFGGKPIGVGKANCDSTQAREAMGKHGKKPVVHYDYLYIE